MSNLLGFNGRLFRLFLALIFSFSFFSLIPSKASVGRYTGKLEGKVENYKLVEYDELVFVHTKPGMSPQKYAGLPVLPSGTVTFPGFGEFYVIGKTIDEIKSEMDIPEDESVDILIDYHQRKHVFVIGQVLKPGSYSVKDLVSVYDAIATAGGFTDLANKKKVKVVRQNLDGTRKTFYINFPKEVFNAYEKGIGKEKFLVQEGDIVFVPKSIFKMAGKYSASLFQFATLGAIGGVINASLD